MHIITCPHCGEPFPNISEFMRAAAADALYKFADEYGIEPGEYAGVQTDKILCNICGTSFHGEYGAMDIGAISFQYSFTLTAKHTP